MDLTTIKKIYFDNNCIYGAKRIFEILKLQGNCISYKTVHKLCKQNNLVSITSLTKSIYIPKPLKLYDRNLQKYNNQRKELIPTTINKVWVCDWTRFYLNYNKKSPDIIKIIYVFVIMDLFSRKIIGVGTSYDGELPIIQNEVLKKTIIYRNAMPDLIIHSDNGSSFNDTSYIELLNSQNMKQTFNRPKYAIGDNAYMESFFATLKKEFYAPSFITVKSNILSKYITPHLTTNNFLALLKKYICFYNNKRAHSAIGYITPREFESSIKTYIPKAYSRSIMHIDINACFAQYEMMLNPKLKNSNLVVIGEEYKRDSIIVCASYNARKYNIGCGDSLRYANHVCPNLVVRKSKKELYKKISKKFFDILYRYTDQVEPYGIDEAWIDVTNSLKLFGSPFNIAKMIMKDLKNEMGITVSIGISFNKIFSKLASDLHKPNAITYIPFKYFRKITKNLPVEMLLFVGEKSKELFNFYGIKTISDLAFSNKNIVKEIVGEKNANKLINYANGYEFSMVRKYNDPVPIKSISRAETTYKNMIKYTELKLLMLKLCEDVAKKLRDKKLSCNTICIKIRDYKYKETSIQHTFKLPSNNGIYLSHIANKIVINKLYPNDINMKKFNSINNNITSFPTLKDYFYIKELELPKPIREISVQVTSLSPSPYYKTKASILDDTIDKLNNHYQTKVVTMGYMSEPWINRYKDNINYEIAKKNINSLEVHNNILHVYIMAQYNHISTYKTL